MNAILSPSHRLTQVIGSSNKTVVSPWEIGKSSHQVVLPYETEIDEPGGEGPSVEVRATPGFPERLRIGSLRNTHDDALGVLHVPCDTAVWPSKCVKVRE